MIRSLKVQTHIVPAKGYRRQTSKHRPKLLLCGEWLRQAGIEPRTRVTVEVLEDRIIITQ